MCDLTILGDLAPRIYLWPGDDWHTATTAPPAQPFTLYPLSLTLHPADLPRPGLRARRW
jgi:hypothetical protein